MKTGQCKFGVTCKYNHPPNMGGTQKMAMDKCMPCATFNEKGYPSRPGQQRCEFYMKTGECKFGATCRFDHPFHVQVNPQMNMRPADRMNSKGLPIRHGGENCTFYMKNGDCKFGPTCRFNHPELGATASTQPAAQNALGLPLRPGVPPCSFYMKTGDCKFGITCKFDHPEMSQERLSELKLAQFNRQAGTTQAMQGGQGVNTASVMQVSESNNVGVPAKPATVNDQQAQEQQEYQPKELEAVDSKE
mmetsp:Transcript_29970/g.41765  ORF Transcript_29970/g.41765 Transcript_29970/m.41765 type:complete len:247 (+) Transcript_29970:276-1016(+)